MPSGAIDIEAIDALVIGAGPSGLMAAETLVAAGRHVVVVDAKPSPARKFLMAGKSGLNLAKAGAEPDDWGPWLAPMLAEFGSEAVANWARGLGQDIFTGSSGRIFPVAMKASPLLRAWLARLDTSGVQMRSRWRWTGWVDDAMAFAAPSGPRLLRPAVTVLALGGASWSRLGSDGTWMPWLAARGVKTTPFRPANMGFRVEWSPHMTRHFGAPVKGVALVTSDGQRERGEFVVTARGLEGGGIYAVSRPLREGAALTLDLAPDLGVEALEARLARARPGDTLSARLRKAGLSAVTAALVMEWGRLEPGVSTSGRPPLALNLKALRVPLGGPMAMEGAISVAGGICRTALTQRLELRALRGVFACGEMLDWEAPTGGYLITGCLATGRWAGRAAAG